MPQKGKRIVFNCGACGIEVEDYASNRRSTTKSGLYFCSTKCAGEGRRVVLSLANGGDGVLRSKQEKDARHYRQNADHVRGKANEYYSSNRLNILEQRRLKDRAAKLEVVTAYGGRCACCGESQIEFLTIDHVNNDGALHRRRVGKGRRIYKDLIALGFPEDNYRLLCFNCNITRGFYGYCPHKPEDKSITSHVPIGIAGRKQTVA